MQKDPEKNSLLAHVLADRRYAAMLGLGFSAGIPFLLVYVTQSAWLSEAKVPIETIGSALDPFLRGAGGGSKVEQQLSFRQSWFKSRSLSHKTCRYRCVFVVSAVSGIVHRASATMASAPTLGNVHCPCLQPRPFLPAGQHDLRGRRRAALSSPRRHITRIRPTRWLSPD